MDNITITVQRARDHVMYSPNWLIDNATTALEAQGTQWKSRQEDSKKPKKQEFAVRLCLLERSEKLHPWCLNNMLSKQNSNKDNTNRHTNMEKGNHMGP